MSIHLDKLNSSNEKVLNDNEKNKQIEANRNYYLAKRPFLTLGMTFGFTSSMAGFFSQFLLGADKLPDWWPALWWLIGLLGLVIMATFLVIVIRNDRKLKVTKEVIQEFRQKRREGRL